ncbi:hypothetical protein GCM10029964_038740 [Kibdelosporangium lantanae]
MVPEVPREALAADDPDRGRGHDPLVDTNAGLYLIDCRFFRQLLATGGLVGMLSSRLDWGGDLLPWLIAKGAPVLSWPIERFGDLGSPKDYLQTVQSVLSGDYPDLAKMLPAPFADDVWVHESTLHHRDPATGLTLADKVRAGLVDLGEGSGSGGTWRSAPASGSSTRTSVTASTWATTPCCTEWPSWTER